MSSGDARKSVRLHQITALSLSGIFGGIFAMFLLMADNYRRLGLVPLAWQAIVAGMMGSAVQLAVMKYSDQLLPNGVPFEIWAPVTLLFIVAVGRWHVRDTTLRCESLQSTSLPDDRPVRRTLLAMGCGILCTFILSVLMAALSHPHDPGLRDALGTGNMAGHKRP